MFTNKLKLNPAMTEFILIGSQKRNQLLPHFPTINILRNQVSIAQSVRNLWVLFNSNFNFSDHMSQVIKFTRVHARDNEVQFKIGLITYKILNQGQPVYQRELIHPYNFSRNARQSTPKLKFLHTPTFHRKVHKSIKHFSNSFSHCAQVLWNSFPFHIRNSPSVPSFRKHLKNPPLRL